MSTIELTCKQCQNTFIVPFKGRNRKFCDSTCFKLYQRGENSPSFGKTYNTKESNPEWALKVSKTHKLRGHILGEKNPMKNPDVALKMGATRSKRFETDPEFKTLVSVLMCKAWKEGKYDNVEVGHCRWFSFTKSNGETCKVQGTWELAYANWLDSNDITFDAHRGRIKYLDENKTQRSYYPDFYLPLTNEYVEIKNKYHFGLNPNKWDQIRICNPDLNLTLLFKEDLVEKGIL